MDINEIISADPERLGGLPVFEGTRVPIESLLDHIEDGISLDEFLEDFPTVSREQAITVLGYDIPYMRKLLTAYPF